MKNKYVIGVIAFSIIQVLAIFIFYMFFRYSRDLVNYVPINKEGISVNTKLYDELKDETKLTQNQFDSIQNFVFFGSDSRVVTNMEAGRSDTIMICSINPVNKTIKLISIPRDTYVSIPGYYRDKINHAYAYGKEELSMKTINQNFNLNIDKYITIDFPGMVKVIDAIGGIELTIDKDEMDFINYIAPGSEEYSDIKIPKLSTYGTINLTGAQALAHSRNRTTGGGNDFARGDRQRQVVTAMFKKFSSKSYEELQRYLDLLLVNVKTNITEAEFLKMIPSMLTDRDEYLTKIISTQIPSTEYSSGQMINGIYYFVPDLDRTKSDFVEYIFNK